MGPVPVVISFHRIDALALPAVRPLGPGTRQSRGRAALVGTANARRLTPGDCADNADRAVAGVRPTTNEP